MTQTNSIQTLFLFLFTMMWGCAAHNETESTTWERRLLEAWQSPHSTAEARVAALNKWVPRGTDGATLEKLLGKGSAWGRYRGPVAYQNGTWGPYAEYWSLEYPVGERLIRLGFRKVPGPGFQVAFTGADLTYIPKAPSSGENK
jgi:hypothetical protein